MNGKIIEEENYVNGKKNGLQRKWMENGQLWIKEIYDKGLFRLYVAYFKNVSIKKQVKRGSREKTNKIGYKINRNDLVFNLPEKGKREVAKEWDINGNILSKVIHYDYQGCRLHKEWYESGGIKLRGIGFVENWLKMKMLYKNGQLKEERKISAKCWDEKGKEIACL